MATLHEGGADALERARRRAGARLPAPLWRALVDAARGQPETDPSLPGHIYEAMVARDRDRRRGKGAFYTPEVLVGRVLSLALEPLLVGKTASEIKKIRILDPSCGGGVFLLSALDVLERACAAAGARPTAALRRELAERCLLGFDIDPVAVEVSRLSLALAAPGATLRSSLECRDALDLGAGPVPPIDVVVGNPPWGQKGIRFPEPLKSRYRRDFVSARGHIDPFALFIERAIGLLKDGGRWGLVLPDILLLKNFEACRRLILRTCVLEDIVDLGRAFEGVNLDCLIMVARKRSDCPRSHRVRVWSPASDRAPARRQRQRMFEELPAARFNLHIGEDELRLWRRLHSEYPRIGDAFEIHEGVHTGNVRGKLFRPTREHRCFRKVVVGGKEVARYRLEWGGTWLDPRPSAVDRDAGEYANIGRAEWFEAGKLVVRRTGDHVVAAHDPDGLWCSNNLFVLVPRAPMTRTQLLAHCALLNSRLHTWFFRALQPRTGRLFAELKIVHLRDFPTPRAEDLSTETLRGLAALAKRAERQGEAAIADQLDERAEALFAITPAERDYL